MKPGGGGIKGRKFERTISKKLSIWWSNGERDDLFWRTQGSGARATTRSKRGIKTEGQDGDIASTSNESIIFAASFIIECKNYKSINIWNIFTNKKCDFQGWWIKLKSQAKDVNKRPLLIAKENNHPIVCCMEHYMYTAICATTNPNFTSVVECSIGSDKVALILLDELLTVDVEKFKAIFDKEC